jgi:hypothetical protein
MERAEADKLADLLTSARREIDPRTDGGGPYAFIADDRDAQPAYIRSCECGAPRIVFAGGPHGPHGLCIATTNEERVLAHWRGYLAASVEGAAPRVVALVERWAS